MRNEYWNLKNNMHLSEPAMKQVKMLVELYITQSVHNMPEVPLRLVESLAGNVLKPSMTEYEKLEEYAVSLD